jgi:PAS domain S-box-containing protein
MTHVEDDRMRGILSSLSDPTGCLTAILTHSQIAFAIWQPDGRVVLTAPAFRELFLIEPTADYNLLSDERFATSEMRRAFEQAVAGETVNLPASVRLRGEMTLLPLRSRDGAVEYVGTICHAKATDERFRRLSDAGIIGIITTDFDGNIREANDAFLNIVGYSAADVRAGHVRWTELTPPDWRHLDQRAVEQLRTTGVAAPWEKEYIRKDGTRVPILIGVALLDRGSGECIAFILDLTERRQTEEALRLSERRFRGFKDSGIIGIVISDMVGNIKEVNDAFLAIVGYTREDLAAGKVSGRTLNTPEREKTDATAFAQLRGGGVAKAWQKELVRKDGTRAPILNGVVVVDEKAQECVAFMLDLTELKQAEAAARESAARKAAVMEAALDAIVLMDHNGMITDFNPAAERTFGYSRDEVIGKELAEVIIPAHLRVQHRAGLRAYLASGEGGILGRRIEVVAIRKDGSEFPAEVAVVRIRSAGDALFTGYIRDITERKQAALAEILRREKEAAQAANRELEAFSYSVAHDLRAPLRGISGFSNILAEDYGDKLDEGGKALIQRVTASVTRMALLIDALLGLARLSRAELKRQPVDLTNLMRATFERLRAADPTRSVELAVNDDIVVDADPELLGAVVENLVGNAWKFTRKQPAARIELGRSTSDEVVRYYVRDNGAGFDMRFANRLFSAFQRLHSADQFEGTGVGLATVQRIIHRHGGRVWAEAAENAGATFWFTLTEEPTGEAHGER